MMRWQKKKIKYRLLINIFSLIFVALLQVQTLKQFMQSAQQAEQMKAAMLVEEQNKTAIALQEVSALPII